MSHRSCLLCDDTGWICENHANIPSQGDGACTCGGAGVPLPALQPDG